MHWKMRSYSSFMACRYRAFFPQFHGNFHWNMTSHALWMVCRQRAFFLYFFMERFNEKWDHTLHSWHVGLELFVSQFHGNFDWTMSSHALWAVCRYRASFWYFFWKDALKNEIRLFIRGMSVPSFFSQFHGNCWKMACR